MQHTTTTTKKKVEKKTLLPETDSFEAILAAQDGRLPGFCDYATAEIRRGAKRSCWIWYIWPSCSKVRRHRLPSMLLRSFFGDHVAYLQHPVLGPRLLEITKHADHQLLHRRVSPDRLFDASLDSEKFHESCSCFAIAAVSINDEASAAVLCQSFSIFGRLHEKVVQAFLQQEVVDDDDHDHDHDDGNAKDRMEIFVDRIRALIPPPANRDFTKKQRANKDSSS